MKRAIILILLAAACVIAFLSVRGTMPFIPIYGSSMEPTLNSGSLLTISSVDPKDIKVGDIIVYNVPSMVQDYYSYPPTVAHRVIKIITQPTLGYRTGGDNTGEDPFTVRPQDIRGAVGSQIPYLGVFILFFQSQQGLIFAVVALVLLAIFLYGNEIGRGRQWAHRGFFSPVIVEEKKASRLLSRQLEGTEKRMEHTEEALEKFSAAVSEYAKHLASHTSAIQGLSEASHELKKGAAEQNRVLSTIMDNVQKPRETIVVQEIVAASATKPAVKPVVKPAVQPYHGALNKNIVGCARQHTWSSHQDSNPVAKQAKTPVSPLSKTHTSHLPH